MERKCSVVYLRGIATLLIFFCHILLISGYEKSSMWLNTGVQIFFIISAYLLAKKELASWGNIKQFFVKRCKRIFISYWLYIIIISLLLVLVHRQPDFRDFVIYFWGMKGFFKDANILGLGHLWFVTVILICYLITPVLYYISRLEKKARRIGSIVICVIIVTFSMFVLNCNSYSIYILGYMWVYLYFGQYKKDVEKKELLIWSGLAIFFSILRLYMDNSGIETANWYEIYDAICVPIFRFFLAMGIVIIFLYAEDFFAEKQECEFIKRFVELSYEFYLTHQFIQLFLWRFVEWFKSSLGIWVWIVLSFALSWFSALVLRYFTIRLEKNIKKKGT